MLRLGKTGNTGLHGGILSARCGIKKALGRPREVSCRGARSLSWTLPEDSLWAIAPRAWGSQTPGSQSTAALCLNSSIPDQDLQRSKILKATQMLLPPRIMQRPGNPRGVGHQLAEEWFWYKTTKTTSKSCGQRADIHFYAMCCSATSLQKRPLERCNSQWPLNLKLHSDLKIIGFERFFITWLLFGFVCVCFCVGFCLFWGLLLFNFFKILF